MAPPNPVFARIEQAIVNGEEEAPKKPVKSKKKIAQAVAES